MILTVFIIFYLIGSLIAVRGESKYNQYILLVCCILLTFIGGGRDENLWSDTQGYLYCFEKLTPTVFDFSFQNLNLGLVYKDRGFFLLSSIIRTFTSNSTIYFTCIAALSFICLYKVLNKYCLYPLIGLCVYIARFMLSREFVQIRAGLAIMFFLVGLDLITNNRFKKYAIVSTISCFLHQSLLFAVPLYFINKIRIKKKHIVIGLLISFLLAGLYSGIIVNYVSNFSEENEVAMSYASQTYASRHYLEGKGLLNPMIYYQVIILLLFTFFENKLKVWTQHYFTIRNAYFLSTLLLITLSSFNVLAGRSSTIFATCEMLIVPLFIKIFPTKTRIIGILGIGAIYAIFFWMNFYGLKGSVTL